MRNMRKTSVILLSTLAALTISFLIWTPRTVRSRVQRAAALSMGARELSGNDIVRQGSSRDCGRAALCNLLRSLNQRCGGDDLVDVHSNGASLLDLQQAAARRGVLLDGWYFQPSRSRIPATPFLAHMRYGHFVTVTGTNDRLELEVQDPAVGSMLLPESRFRQIWSGSCLIRRSIRR